MKIQIIPVAAYDNIFSLKEKIYLVKAQRVILNDLESSPIFQDKKSAKLLARMIKKAGKTALVVTQNETANLILIETGFNIVQDLYSAQKFIWEKKYVSPQDFPVKQPRSIYLRNDHRKSDTASWIKYSALFICLCSILVLILLLSPSATIIVDIPDMVQEIQLPIIASSPEALSNPKNVFFQTDYFDSEAFCSIKISGKKAIPVSAAKGEVELRNLTLDTIAVQEGLVLVSSEDITKEYITTKSGELSGDSDSVIILPIMAKNTGSQGNAKPGEISIIQGPLGLKITVGNSKSVEGGTDVEKAYPSSIDVDRLRNICNEKLIAGGSSDTDIYNQQNIHYFPETIKVVGSPTEVFFPGSDVPTETLNLNVDAELSILSVDEDVIRAYTRPYLDALLLEGYSSSGKIDIKTITITEINPDGSIKILVELSRRSNLMFDRESIKKYAAGKKIQEVTNYINDLYPIGTLVDIAIKPKWFSILPIFPLRINVVSEKLR
jgi:hypothetical protein